MSATFLLYISRVMLRPIKCGSQHLAPCALKEYRNHGEYGMNDSKNSFLQILIAVEPQFDLERDGSKLAK